MAVRVDRRRVLERIRRSAVPVIALVAPAGYGKSYIADRIAREDPQSATIDAGTIPNAQGFRSALAGVPLFAPHAAATLRELLECWRTCEDPITLVLERLDCANDAGLLDAVAMLVRSRPASGKLIMCARRALPIRLSDLVAPHLVATVRADDLRFDGAEMAQLFAETPADDTAVFRASRLTEGWPVPALYLRRLVDEEALDARSDDVADALLRELFDYIDAQVLDKLPAPLVRALVAASGWNDLTETEIEALHGESGTIAQLVNDHQLARLRPPERIAIHPLIRRTIHDRHDDARTAAMRLLAKRFLTGKQFARAAECSLAAGDVAAAASCALQVDGGFLTLVGTPPGTAAQGDDAAGLAMNREMRLAVASASRLIEPARNLPREALSVVETSVGASAALDESALGISVLTLLEAGRSEEAAALVDAHPHAASDAIHGSGLVLLTARLAVLAQQSRFEEGMRLWQPLRRRISGHPVWLSQLIRFEAQAARVRARWEVEHEALERMVSLARSGRAVAVIGLALAEAVFGSWLAGETETYERYRDELLQLVEHNDVPALLRLALAASGRAPRIGRSELPLWDARALLLATAAAQDGAVAARYAQAALEAADLAEEPLTRVLARVAAAEKRGGGRALLNEALALAGAIPGSPLRDSVSALAERGEARGMLAPLVNRLRHRSTVVVAPRDAPLVISLADGTVSRGDEAVEVSDGVLALLAALAVDHHVSREALIDRLWPDLPDDSAYNALKMCVHRARRQLGDPTAIVISRGGYALARGIQVDLRLLQRALQRHDAGDVMREAELPELETTFARLARGRPAAFANWEWFESIETALLAATHELGAILGERALLAGEHVRALAIAHALIKLDPLDERARRLAIGAHLAADDRGAAVLEYRGYKAVLHAELDVEPSPGLKQLLEAG
jgi:DNA-binding SARP family transcriptional activator